LPGLNKTYHLIIKSKKRDGCAGDIATASGVQVPATSGFPFFFFGGSLLGRVLEFFKLYRIFRVVPVGLPKQF